jgi:hypothetical protein
MSRLTYVLGFAVPFFNRNLCLIPYNMIQNNTQDNMTLFPGRFATLPFCAGRWLSTESAGEVHMAISAGSARLIRVAAEIALTHQLQHACQRACRQ